MKHSAKELTWEEWLKTPDGQERANQFMELEAKRDAKQAEGSK